MLPLSVVKVRLVTAVGGLAAFALAIALATALPQEARVEPAAIPASGVLFSTAANSSPTTERPTPSPSEKLDRPAVRLAGGDALSSSDRAQIEGLLAEAIYTPTPVADRPDAASTALRAANPRQDYVAHFNEDGFALAGGKDRDWRLPVRLAAYGAPESLEPLSTASPVQNGERVEFRRGNVTEWYINRPGGIEQGFDVAEAPDGASESLRFMMEVGGGFIAEQDGDDIRLNNADKSARLRYAGLIVKDATGRKLPAAMRGLGDTITVDVDARDAVYPIIVDPTFTQAARLNASDAAAIDQFGYSIDISGSTVVVGANGKDESGTVTDTGAAYVFVKSGGVWSQQARLVPAEAPELNDALGTSIAISGDTVAVGAIGRITSGRNSGAVYVFTRSGTTWTQQAKLVNTDATGTDRFGINLDIDGDTLVVGAHQADDGGVNNSGSVYVFTRSGGVWSQQAELTAADRLASDNLGYSVAISGDTVIAGAYSEDSLGSLSGAAYVFTRSGTIWTQQAKLKASDANADDRFGYFVAASGDTVVVGAPFAEAGGAARGTAYVFTRSGTTWSQQARLQPSSVADNANFGYALAVQGDTAAIGAPTNPAGGITRGAVFVFTRAGGVWTEQQILTASDAIDRDRLGSSVSIDGVSIATGAITRDDAGSSSGAAYVFSDTTLTTTQAVASRTVSVGAAITPFTPVTGSGGLGVLSYAISPGLPAGLSFSTTTGQITGTAASASATTTYTVTVTDQTTPTAQTSSKTFSLTVDPPAAPPLNTTQAVASSTATVGSAITAFTPVTAGGGTGTLSYAVSPGLPAGLTFSTTTGQITGTPTSASAATTYTVTVTDQTSPVAQTSSKTFSLTVNGALDTVQAVASRILTQGVAATAFTPVTAAGGTGTLSYAVSPGLPAGLAFDTTNGQITGTPTATSATATFTVT
ncbi:putative Ig domain-containing protein, partial [Brevundimonas sp.]|uniref:putative Ig domain-containing protein n=1 Tax=Brevundimonas sp. TaxID=1871086 RepID=UPI00260DABE6